MVWEGNSFECFLKYMDNADTTNSPKALKSSSPCLDSFITKESRRGFSGTLDFP